MKRFIFFLLLLAATCSAQNPLTVFHGGTGRSTLTVNSLLYGNGASPVSLLPIGSNGQVLGVSGGALTWTTPAPAITDYVATDPATAHRNLIIPTANSVIPLELKGKSGSSANLFDVQTSGANDVFYIQSNGFVNVHNTLIFDANSGATQLGLDNGSAITFGNANDILTSGATGLLSWQNLSTMLGNIGGVIWDDPFIHTANLIAPSGDIEGLIINPFSGGVKDALQIKIGTALRVQVLAGGNMIAGDVASANTDASLYVRALSSGGGGQIGIVTEAAGASSPDLFQWRKNDHSVIGQITNAGDLFTIQHVGISGHLGVGTQTHPNTVTIVENGGLGSVHLHAENLGVSNDNLLDQLVTTDANNHVLHTWATTTGTNYVLMGMLIGKQTTAGANQGKGFMALCMAGYHNIAGVLTPIGAATFVGQINDLPASNVFFNVNGANIELKVNGGAAVNVTWNFYQIGMMPL